MDKYDFKKMDKIINTKCAFTLAEVLIAMAIIGIVAAITIPALINNFQQKSFISAKAKFLNEVPQALTRYLTDRNMNNLAMTPFVTANGKGEFFSNYMKVVTNCDSSITDCFASDYQNTDGQALPKQPSTICNKAYSLKDNISVCINAKDGWDGQYYDERTKNNENYMSIYYDVNGKKKPNTLGRDYYEAYVLADGTIVDVVPAVRPSIIPEKAIGKYTLTVNSEGCESVGGGGNYAENSIVPIKVVPGDNKDSSLAVAAGNCTLDGSTVTMKNQNCTVNATCTAPVVPETPKYNLTVKNVGCESVTGDGLTTVNSGASTTVSLSKGANITLSVTPGASKSSVIANECNNNTSTSITMPASNCNVTATCKIKCALGGVLIGGKTWGCAFWPHGVSISECNAKKDALGIKHCPDDGDYWVSAVEGCKGVNNLPTEADLIALAKYLYNTNEIKGSTDMTMTSGFDKDKVSALGISLTKGSGKYFWLWSREEDELLEDNYANAGHRYFDNDYTNWGLYGSPRYNTFAQAICVSQ